jgi:hypothetical protein
MIPSRARWDSGGAGNDVALTVQLRSECLNPAYGKDAQKTYLCVKTLRKSSKELFARLAIERRSAE